MTHLIAHFDAASLSPPDNRSGVGVHLIERGASKGRGYAKYIGEATSNEAEYRAAIMAIEKALEHGVTRLTLIGDSQIVIYQITGQYQCWSVNLVPLLTEVKRLLHQIPRWEAVWTPREGNTIADRLSRLGLSMGPGCAMYHPDYPKSWRRTA